ncbi:MAG: ribosome-associated protein [Paraglaciecola psychrophila]|jgi:ribosome-associated protein
MKATNVMNAEAVKTIVEEALDDLKGKDIVTIDVREMTDIADYMVICTGTSNRHVKSLASNVALEMKKRGLPALGVEGVDHATTEWALADFGDVLVHVMLPDTRELYDLEALWSVAATHRDQ